MAATRSLWLTSKEFALEPQTERGMSIVQEKLIAAGSDDTVRSRVISGKPARQLVTTYTKAWEEPDSPGFLSMPLQGLLTADAERRIRRHAAAGTPESAVLLGTPVGQVVGMMKTRKPAGKVVYDFVEGYIDAVERLKSMLPED